MTFDGTSGHLKSINNTQSNLFLNIDQWFMWWNSSDGKNVNSSQASGAYIFRYIRTNCLAAYILGPNVC